MVTDDRTLIIHIDVEPVQGGLVPVLLLARKLDAAQHLLLNIGATLRGGGRRGPWKGEVLEACELMLVELHAGSLRVVTRVTEPPPVLLPDFDIGTEALQRMAETLRAVSERDRATVETFFPDYGQRARVLNSALPLLPEEEAEYGIAIETSVGEVCMRADQRAYLLQLAHEELAEGPDEAIATITGKLYLVQVATGERQIGLLVHNRRVKCYYSAEYEDAIRELVPGSIVEVEGRATLDERGNIGQVEEVFEARPVELMPQYVTRIIYDQRRFRLTSRIAIAVDLRDGLWIHEYEPLGILAYGKSRAESLRAFRMDFAACWDSIAQEDDANLTGDAKELKHKLRALVAEVNDLP